MYIATKKSNCTCVHDFRVCMCGGMCLYTCVCITIAGVDVGIIMVSCVCAHTCAS